MGARKVESRRWAAEASYTFTQSVGSRRAPSPAPSRTTRRPSTTTARSSTDLRHTARAAAYWDLPTDPWTQQIGVLFVYTDGYPEERLYISRDPAADLLAPGPPRGTYLRFNPTWFLTLELHPGVDVRKGSVKFRVEAQNIFNNRAPEFGDPGLRRHREPPRDRRPPGPAPPPVRPSRTNSDVRGTMTRVPFALSVLLAAASARRLWYDEGLLIQNLRGRVFIPKEAVTRDVSTPTAPPRPSVPTSSCSGPSTSGCTPRSSGRRHRAVPAPRDGAAVPRATSRATPTRTAGTTIGDLRFSCLEFLTCKVTSGRFLDYARADRLVQAGRAADHRRRPAPRSPTARSCSRPATTC